jgi:predicted permease
VLPDFRYALRALRKSPGFTLVAVLTLAFGIGADTLMFSVVNAVLVRPLPYARPDRLVHVWETQTSQPSDRERASYPNFLDWRREQAVFAALEGYDETNVTVTGRDGAERANGVRVTSGLLPLLGVAPAIGSGFTEQDDAPGGTQTVLLSHAFWISRFGADPGVVGRTISIDGIPYEIRGVLPRGFSFAPAGDADLWLPLGWSSQARAQRFTHWVGVVGRLRDGVTVEQARLRMAQVMRTLAVEYPETNRGRGATVVALSDVVVGDVARPLLVLMAAVGIVLLIVCADVAGLVLARSVARGHEMALRSALGASRTRIVRQLVVESLVLTLAGAVVGGGLAAEALPVMLAALPGSLFQQMPTLHDASIDLTVLAFTSAIAVGTSIAAGLAPALLSSGRPIAEVLRSDSRTSVGTARRRFRDALVTAQIALSVILLVGATLIGRSLVALLRVDPGFRAERVATVRAAIAGPRYADSRRQQQFFEEVLARVRALPGVEAAGAISSAPLQGTFFGEFRVDGEPEPDPTVRLEASGREVAGDYFQTLGIPLRAGRALDARDNLTAPYAVDISESLARRVFGSRPAVGRRIRILGWEDSAWTIVGVTGDVKTDALDRPAAPAIYYSHLQAPANRMTIVARGVDAAGLVPQLRRVIREIDPGVVTYVAGTMAQYIAASPAVSSRHYLLDVLGTFAVVALVLALLGLYGVIAYAVMQRSREIAIRMALGATSTRVVALVLREGARLVGTGVALGIVAAFAASWTLSSLLFGVSPADARSYVGVSVLLVLVAFVASYLPARWASRVDPMVALRYE